VDGRLDEEKVVQLHGAQSAIQPLPLSYPIPKKLVLKHFFPLYGKEQRKRKVVCCRVVW
jgi:hypothetical protein